MSAADVIAGLRASAEAMRGVQRAFGQHRFGYDALALLMLGKVEPPEPEGLPERTGGAIAARQANLSDLRAAGWRLLPTAWCFPVTEGAAPIAMWSGKWAVLPPDDSEHQARVFDGRGTAQAWATEMSGVQPPSPRRRKVQP